MSFEDFRNNLCFAIYFPFAVYKKHINPPKKDDKK